jgi:hypothetical protein
VSGERPEATREATGVILGALYGVALSLFGHRLLLGRLLLGESALRLRRG